MAQFIAVRRGKLGRYRWFLTRHGKHVAMCGIWGYASRRAAEKAAMRDLGEPVEIYTEDEGPLYAGERDFNN